ncbi:MAG: hypothetical protein JXR95_04665 [Deltaproteobacteria bacterium]|nr:hypothetical protein [Deltaproteobacteria bacterium]
MKYKSILFSVFAVFAFISCDDDSNKAGYEICNNEIDDDENGLTDCNDPVCTLNPLCMSSTFCGDGSCNGSENSTSCPDDCGTNCGDGVCNGSENTTNCIDDCGTNCGDGVCNGSENTTNCIDDCGTNCGDGVCNGFEGAGFCYLDCGYCGDGICTRNWQDYEYIEEDYINCPADCPATCGDDRCSDQYGETGDNCSDDCWKCGIPDQTYIVAFPCDNGHEINSICVDDGDCDCSDCSDEQK